MERILYEVKQVVVGQDHFLERVLVAILAQGHLLVEGVPGLAKTLTVKTLAQHRSAARSSASSSRPTWCRPTWSARASTTRRPASSAPRSGPVFTNLLLADEINRAPAKVQSALLEVMQERQVTIAGETHQVPEPFLVMATQNPIETEGTYPLPEAQVDRFMMKVLVGYPTRGRGVRDRRARHRRAAPTSAPVATTEQLAALQRECRTVYVDPSLIQYAVQLVAATRAPERYGLEGPGAVPHLRREPARDDQPDRRRARARLPARPQLRAARGRDRPGARRAAPPAGAVVRGAGRRPRRRRSSSSASCSTIPAPEKPLAHERHVRSPSRRPADAATRRAACCGGSSGR